MTDKNMDQLEHQLRHALRRQEAPSDFADKMLARVSEQHAMSTVMSHSWWKVFTRPLTRWAAITATAAALVIGGIHYRNVQRERTQGEAAKQQLMLALRIAGSKLQLAKARVNEINATQAANR